MSPAADACPAHANPFRVSAIHSLRFRVSRGEVAHMVAVFEHHGLRGSLVGPKGSGKSTLLAELAARYERHGWAVRRIGLRCGTGAAPLRHAEALSGAAGGALVTVDGYEQADWLSRRAFERRLPRGCGLLVAAHHPVGLPVLHRHTTSVTLLESLVDELAGESEVYRLNGMLREVFSRHDGNIRECFFELYDRWSSRTAP